MHILSFNPGHDGAICFLEDGKLSFSIEAEKDSNYRYSPISSHDILAVLSELREIPDVICTGGWWPREHKNYGSIQHAGYHGIYETDILIEDDRFLGKAIKRFSSSHERAHLLCAYSMSPLPEGTPCYALIWEGALGAFYEIDRNFQIKKIADVMNQPGNRYICIYGLADPSFPKDAPFSRFSDAGKLMALASFSERNPVSSEDEYLINYLLESDFLPENPYLKLTNSKYYNIGLQHPDFLNFAGIYSDRIFDKFYDFAKKTLSRKLPLLIAGGCGLNCDWNSKWRETGLFESVFVPPVTNDSGAAIGTAADAQLHFTGNPKIEWNVYSGLTFNDRCEFDQAKFEVLECDHEFIAELLLRGFILGYVHGKYEIGPRALGNRSIIASPFNNETKERLNEIKQREQFRPVAPIGLEEDVLDLFKCGLPSPYMLYTYQVQSKELAAVTHVNGSARLQTVSKFSNPNLYRLLKAFKAISGVGVLCNTSLNFNGRGFINRIDDLSEYTISHQLDGFVVEGRVFLNRSSVNFSKWKDRESK